MEEKNELTVPERAAVALGAAEHEKALVDLSKKYRDIQWIANQAGREQVHSGYMELKNARIAIEKAGKTAREDANAFQKAVIAEVDRLTAITTAEESRLQTLRDDWDAEREREKQAKAAAEAARIAFIRKRIGEIQAIPSESVGRSAADLAATIELTQMMEITLEEFGEFAGECEMVKIAAIAKLGEMLSAQIAVEAQAKRLAEERAQLARERAEAAERERIAEAERQAQAKKDREALAARQAELAEQERKAAAARAAQEAEQRAAQERAAAAMQAERDAHERRIAAEREEIARQQAEINAERQRQADEAARVEREKQEAIEAEAVRIAAEQAAAAQAEADRIFAEQQRIEAARLADLAEKARREQVQFEKFGPAQEEILSAIAEEFDVSREVARHWLSIHNWHVTGEKAA